MPKPMCVPCQRFFRPRRNGVRVLESKPLGSRPEPGTSQADRWVPYKVWSADLWECQGCGAQIVSGWGHGPMSQDYLPGFEDEVATCGLIVNDC
jgi:hypothetical protein